MPKLAIYDHTAPQPSRVRAWRDTDAHTYASEPDAADTLVLTEAQWAARLSTPYVQGGALVAAPAPEGSLKLPHAAAAALRASDTAVLRCYEAGVPVPAEWRDYRAALRGIVSGNSTAPALPARPAFPAGT